MSVQDQVFKKVAETMGVEVGSLTPETKFVDLGADSLDMVEFSMDVEDAFKVSIEQSDMVNIKTLGDAVAFIQSKSKG
jgi:acyl carrier protein